MIEVRRSTERGYEDKGWTKSFHTFSFDTFYDPDFLGFSHLRVINEEHLKGGKGFGSRMNKDSEIITYVLEGALEHQDSLGNTCVIRPEELLLLSTGSGIIHSEYNLSHHAPAHFIQMWITPDQSELTPSISKKLFSSAAKWGRWCLLISRNGREGSLKVHQDVEVYTTLLEDNDELLYENFFERQHWIHVISGKFLIQETILDRGDAACISGESDIEVRCLQGGELLLFDLP